MKTDRWVILLACLLLAAVLPAAGKKLTIGIGGARATFETSSAQLAAAVAQQVGAVQGRFGANRATLKAVKDSKGKAAFAQEDVAGLIVRTREDLDQALEKAQPGKTEPLRAWAAEELGGIQRELTATANRAAFSPPAVAVVASLGAPPRPKPAPPKAASPKPVPPQPPTVPADVANGLLDQVAAAVNRIFVLASHEDLEVKLWVGSTPAPKATFRFWSKGSVKESPPAPTILQTAGKKDHVLRGLYSYRATWGKGPVVQVIEYPALAGSSAAGMSSERLDLVKNSRFFCCQFNESYCHHVDDEKDCR